MNSARFVRAAVAAVLAATLLTACSGGGDNGAVPRDWIRKTYSAAGSGWLDPDSSPREVAQAIHAQRAALDRASGGRSEFLRYGDDMVTVSQFRSGSLIEIEDYRNGYRRHQQHLIYWPDPSSGSFRGGGPGEGK